MPSANPFGDLASPVYTSDNPFGDLASPIGADDAKALAIHLKKEPLSRQRIPGVYDAQDPVPSVPWGPFTPGEVGGGMLQAGLDIGSALSRIIPLGATGDEFQRAAQNIDVSQQQAGEGMFGELVRGSVR